MHLSDLKNLPVTELVEMANANAKVAVKIQEGE